MKRMKIRHRFGLVVGLFGLVGVIFFDTHTVAQGADATPTTVAAAQEPMVICNLEGLKRIDLSDATARRKSWDTLHLVTALQGLVNRDQPRLYLFFVEQWGVATDRFWLKRFTEPNPADGGEGWLAKREFVPIDDVESLLAHFCDAWRGVVVYDERVPATSNLASTIAGVESLLPIRFDPSSDSLYHRLVEAADGPRLPVVKKLLADDGSPLFTGDGTIPGTTEPSTGSAKADAYRWLLAHYIKPGKCRTDRVGYYIDTWWLDHPNDLQNALLVNHDYGISLGGFFFDASPWEDETPVDDPDQPLGTDFAVFCDLLRAANEKNPPDTMIHVAGFTPWDTKYTDHPRSGGKHEAVPTEWRHAEVVSSFNGFMDADALGLGAMANGSFFRHFPLEACYPQPRPTVEGLAARGAFDEQKNVADRTFVMLYIGDYDSAAWVYQAMPILWSDRMRGSLPIGWAFNPNLADRFAPGFDFLRRTATPNDSFIAGDSGAGYVNPMGLVPPRRFSGLPSGVERWRRHCAHYYQQWDLTITGFVIDGFAPATDEAMRKIYANFSPDGIVQHHPATPGITDGMPWLGMAWDLSDVAAGADKILADAKNDSGPTFRAYRTILWRPSQLGEMVERVEQSPDAAGAANAGRRIVFLSPHEFFAVMKRFLASEAQ